MQQVGRYRLTRRLGQGGMAEVFEAVAEGEGGFRRRVALKRVLPQLAGDLSIARMFLDEARTTSHLHHANIVSVLDYGTADGSAFQVLEYVDGLDLDGLLRKAEERNVPLPVGLTLYLVLQVAHALDYAHDAKDETGSALGIVHRDVSPSNVLVAWDGHVKLSDFGIALAANRLERTEGAGIKGKLEYMSPEQVVRGPIDRRSDVFALGCMLHRLLTGKSPLAELSALTRMASGEELALDSDLDPKLREMIARATRHARTQRYGSAGELARALSAVLPTYLPEEPTFALKRWLGALREEAKPKSKRGALDALLNVELVLHAPDGGTQERSFVSRTPVASNVPAAVAEGPQARPPASDANAAPAPPVVRGRRPWLLSTLLLAGVSFAVAVLMLAPDEWPHAPPPLPASVTPPLAAPEPSEAKQVVSQEEVTLAPALDPSPAPVTRSRRTRPRPSPKPLADTTPTPVPVLAPGVGTLVVGGDGALRAEIRIDGRPMGFAPKRLELSAGEHEVLLVRPDGTRVGPRLMQIQTHHTQSAPAKWLVE